MPRAIHDPHFGSSDVEFVSDYPLDESVQRLQDATKGRAAGIRGTVAETYVSISRAALVRHDFRPWFFGRFHVEQGRVVLRGSYSMHDGAKAAMGLWLGVCAIALYRAVDDARYGLASPWLPLVPLGMAALGGLVAWLGRHATRHDPEWINDVIWAALKLPL